MCHVNTLRFHLLTLLSLLSPPGLLSLLKKTHPPPPVRGKQIPVYTLPACHRCYRSAPLQQTRRAHGGVARRCAGWREKEKENGRCAHVAIPSRGGAHGDARTGRRTAPAATFVPKQQQNMASNVFGSLCAVSRRCRNCRYSPTVFDALSHSRAIRRRMPTFIPYAAMPTPPPLRSRVELRLPPHHSLSGRGLFLIPPSSHMATPHTLHTP